MDRMFGMSARVMFVAVALALGAALAPAQFIPEIPKVPTPTAPVVPAPAPTPTDTLTNTADPLPALPGTVAVGTKQLTTAVKSAATRLRAGLPTRGMLLSFSGLPAGTLTAILGKSVVLARGEADTKAGKARVRLKPNAAGRKALRGSGSLHTQLKLIFTPDAGGKQATVIKSVTLKRRR